VHESPFLIETALKDDAVEVGIEPHEVSRRGVGDHGSALDLPARVRAVDPRHHAVDEPAYIADEAMIMAEECSEHLGECGDDLAVREAQQEPLVHVLTEEQGALLRA
jgi:hypothetical protein